MDSYRNNLWGKRENMGMNTIELLRKIMSISHVQPTKLNGVNWGDVSECFLGEIGCRRGLYSDRQFDYITGKVSDIFRGIEICQGKEDFESVDNFLSELVGMLESMPDESFFYEKKIDEMYCSREDLLFYTDLLGRRTSQLQYLKNRSRCYKASSKNDNSYFTGKGCVYTVIVGRYDEIQPPCDINKGWDYILFTDNREIRSDSWKVIYVDNELELDNIRWSRLYKVLPFIYLSEYDYSIYIDGNMRIIGDLEEYIYRYSVGSSMLCVNHYMNVDAYQEASLCINKGRDDRSRIERQIAKYKAEGFPEEYGLTANGFIIRSHRDKALNNVMEDWWNEINDYSSRDQLSLQYACWKNGYSYDTSDIYIMDNPYIKIYDHL